MTSRSGPKFEADYFELLAPAHLAFAFSVVRSKPPHIPIDDYIEGLRSAIVFKPGLKSPGTFSFDADMYWKASYQEAESARLRLANELDQVKRERDSLQLHQNSQYTKGQPALGKRKRDTSVQRGPGKMNKIQPDSELDDDDIDLDLANLTSPTTNHQALLRGFVQLRRNLLLSEPDQEALANAINATCGSISNILLEGTQTTRMPHTEKEGQSIKEICTAFKRIYPSIIRALEFVEPQKDDCGIPYSPVLPSVVKTFQAFLGRLHKFALDELARREQEAKRNKRASGRRSTETFELGYAPISEENLARAISLTQMLVKMLTMLDVSKDLHCELLEGCMCAILDHIGSSLSLLVFADTGLSNQKQIGILSPNGLLDIGRLNIDSAIGTATIEGPYVLYILRQGVEFLLANAKRMSKQCLLTFTVQPGVKDGMGDSDLSRQIQETLQNTLLRGAFGDKDDTFYNSLRRESEEETDLTEILQEIKRKESSVESFIGELWDHLGWDILSGRRGS